MVLPVPLVPLQVSSTLNAKNAPALMADVAQEALPLLAQVRICPAGGARSPPCRRTRTGCPLSSVQVSRLQDSAVFRAALELDFENDTFGSITQLMCEKREASAGNASASAGYAGHGRDRLPFTANSPGRSIEPGFLV